MSGLICRRIGCQVSIQNFAYGVRDESLGPSNEINGIYEGKYNV